MVSRTIRWFLAELREFRRATLFSDEKAVQAVILLTSLDLVFLFIHVFKALYKEDFIALFGNWLYRNLTVTNDWAMPEIFNYLKMLAIVYLLCRIYAAIRQPVYFAWAFVYSVALLDDTFQMHEHLGHYIAKYLGGYLSFSAAEDALYGIRDRDIGELIVFALYGGTLLVVVSFGFLRSDAQHRMMALGLVVLMGCLGFFAVAVDFLARIVQTPGVAATIEDWGEMLVLSFTLGYALVLCHRYASHRYPVLTGSATPNRVVDARCNRSAIDA